MDIIGMLILIGFFALFGWLLYYAIQSSRRDTEKKKELAQLLGFSPVETNQNLWTKLQHSTADREHKPAMSFGMFLVE